MTRVSEMHKQWSKDPKYRKTYDALQQEFALAGGVIESRKRAGLTRQPLAPENIGIAKTRVRTRLQGR